LCSILTAVDLTTSYGVPTFVFETLNQHDFPDQKRGINVPDKFCAFNDLRFEPSCDNWTATIEQKHDNELEWTNILTNYENGMCLKSR
jgi:hypothetical protein